MPENQSNIQSIAQERPSGPENTSDRISLAYTAMPDASPDVRAILADKHPSCVVSEATTANIVCLSLPHLRRLRRAGVGPRYVKLGERRVGYQIRAILAWLDARTVGGAD